MLKNLKNLVLRGNNFNKIDQIDGMCSLQFLDISVNKIRNIEKSNIGLLPSLRTLICDDNYLKNINAFVKLTSLVYISFESNKIQEFQNFERLAELEYLKDLNLNNNPITKQYQYRNNIVKKFVNLAKSDGLEITKDERDLCMMEAQIESSEMQGQGYVNMLPLQKINGNNPMKVKYVNLDLMFGGNTAQNSNHKVIQWEDNPSNYRNNRNGMSPQGNMFDTNQSNNKINIFSKSASDKSKLSKPCYSN